jgi:hypothetical protein
VSVENWRSNQQRQERVEKNVEKLNEFFGLRPNDVHDRLFEVLLVDLMMMMMVVMVMVVVMMGEALLTQLIVQLKELCQSFVLDDRPCAVTIDEIHRRQDKPENGWSTTAEWIR